MNEIKQPPRKRTIAYYLTVLLVVMLLNSMLMPALTRRTIKEVDYGTFMTMTEQKEISEVDPVQQDCLYGNGRNHLPDRPDGGPGADGPSA